MTSALMDPGSGACGRRSSGTSRTRTRASPDARRSRGAYGRRMPEQQHTYRRWLLAMTLGELAAFSVPTTVWGLAAVAGLSDQAAYLPVVLAGAGEGAVLGCGRHARCGTTCPR